MYTLLRGSFHLSKLLKIKKRIVSENIDEANQIKKMGQEQGKPLTEKELMERNLQKMDVEIKQKLKKGSNYNS